MDNPELEYRRSLMFHLNLDFILFLLSFFKSLIALGILLQQTQLTINMCIIMFICTLEMINYNIKNGYLWGE